MKKIISVFCVLAVLMAVLSLGVVGASAAEPARTIVDVKSGDTVTYYLYLSGCKENVICADYSVYYDSDVLRVDAVADYNNSFDDEDVESIINTDVKNEINANFIKIGKGVDFSKPRTFIAVKFTALKSASTHISYYVRDMAGNSYFEDVSKPEITEYLFTCDVTVNSTKILEEAQPELNTEEPQAIGSFVNSVNGDSKDADYVASEQDNGGNSGNTPAQDSTSASDGKGAGSDATDPAAASEAPDSSASASDPAGENGSADVTDVPVTPGVDGSASDGGADTATTGTNSDSGSSFPWIWIVLIGVVLLGGGAAAAVLSLNKKKKSGTND